MLYLGIGCIVIWILLLTVWKNRWDNAVNNFCDDEEDREDIKDLRLEYEIGMRDLYYKWWFMLIFIWILVLILQ